MSKKKQNTSNMMKLIMIILILAVLFLIISNFTDYIPTENGKDNDNTYTEGENCEWVTIDEVNNYNLMAGTVTEWRGTVPEGSFRYLWDYEYNLASLMGVLSGTLHNVPSSVEGAYYFETDNTEAINFEVTNAYRSDIMINSIKLDQWICDDDPRNWNPSMFDSPYKEGHDEDEQEEDICATKCQGVGYSDGYTWDGTDCIEGYTQVGVDLMTVCCCKLENL